MRRWKAAWVLLALAPVSVGGQETPREVLLLARLKDHLRKDLGQLADHTCLVTFTRFHKPASHRARMALLDTIRLEVLFSGKHEFYASPGDRRFSRDNPVAFTSSGMSGTGLFALHLRSILTTSGVSFSYGGEQKIDGRSAVRYDFLLPAYLSGYTISVVGGSGSVGTAGSLWADPKSLELLRLETHAIEIPPYLPVEDAISRMTYANVRLDGSGGKQVRLPQSGELYLRESSGEENLDFVEFTHCRSFRAESTLNFGLVPPEVEREAPAPATDPKERVPALLLVRIRLETPVKKGDAVGTLINGRVLGPVYRKGKAIIPDGAAVRGRIRRLEQVPEIEGQLAVGFEFTEVEVDGRAMRFYADLERIERAGGKIGRKLSRRRVHRTVRGGQVVERVLVLPELPGVASFLIREDRLSALPEMQMVWRTRSLLR